MPARKNRADKYGMSGYLGEAATPEERLLLAIFGRDPGSTFDETLARMRRDALQEDA